MFILYGIDEVTGGSLRQSGTIHPQFILILISSIIPPAVIRFPMFSPHATKTVLLTS